jgi:hypothetical protein
VLRAVLQSGWCHHCCCDGSCWASTSAAISSSGSPSATTFTYDLSGVSTVSGASNSFPFLYQGLEHEVTDPGQLYFEPSGNVYNPQIQRELSLVDQQGITGAPSGSGFGGFGNFGAHGGSPGGPSLSTTFSNLWTVGTAFSGAESLSSPYGFLSFGGSDNPINIPTSLIGDLLSLFGIGGGGDQEKPYQLDHGKNQNWEIVGVADGLTPTQKSAKCPCPTAPVLPKGNVNDNIRASQQNGKVWAFNKLRPFGEWDYDRKFGYSEEHDYAGNFNFGACGRAVGVSDLRLVSIGGADQMFFHPLSHGFGPGFPFVKDPYGDTKAAAIRDGERYYDCGCY